MKILGKSVNKLKPKPITIDESAQCGMYSYYVNVMSEYRCKCCKIKNILILGRMDITTTIGIKNSYIDWRGCQNR